MQKEKVIKYIEIILFLEYSLLSQKHLEWSF